jgi:hypothetical protein
VLHILILQPLGLPQLPLLLGLQRSPLQRQWRDPNPQAWCLTNLGASSCAYGKALLHFPLE